MTKQLNYKKCAEFISAHDNFMLITHKNPDGDTAGTAAALCAAMRRIGKTAYLYPNPQFTDKLKKYINDYIADENYAADCIVAVDVASESQFPRGFSGHPELCIDHHPSNTAYADLSLVRPEKAACAQAVFEVIKRLGGEISAEEATLLYLGLSTDCGCFQYGNTDKAAFTAAAELIALGADNMRVNEDYFRKISPARMKLEGMIYSGMEFYHNGDIVVATITQAMIAEAGAVEDDCDDLAALAGKAQGTLLSITIRENTDGSSKISMRSGPAVNSSDICAVFGGGGHAMAAGCGISEPPAKAKELLLEAAEKFLR